MITQSKFYNNDSLGQAFSNLQSLYAPPSASELAGYAAAKATREKAERLAEFNRLLKDPTTSREMIDRLGFANEAWNPSQSYYSVDRSNETLRSNNAADNTRAVQTNAADNANAITLKMLDPIAADATRIVPPSLADFYKVDQTQSGFNKTAADNAAQMDRRRAQDDAMLKANADDNATILKQNAANNERAAFNARFGTPLGQNQILPSLPADVAAKYNLPTSDPVIGAILAGQGDTVTTPDGRVLKGVDKPLTAEQWQAEENARLLASGKITDQQLVDAIVGKQTPVEAVGPDGKPYFTSPGDAVRNKLPAAVKTPTTVVNMTENGAKLGDPEPGLAWARNPDGTVKLDERGAPIALPYQNSKRYLELQDAERAKVSKTASQAIKNDIVAEDIDRALTSIVASPNLTTGLGAQLTSGIGDMPAHDLRALLDTIKANIGFDQLQAMREASPTGGALGQVTDNEQRLLQSVLGSLENSQSADQLTDNLRRLKNTYLDVIHGAGKGPAREPLKFNQPSSTDAAPRRAINPDTGEELILRNGKWERAQ